MERKEAVEAARDLMEAAKGFLVETGSHPTVAFLGIGRTLAMLDIPGELMADDRTKDILSDLLRVAASSSGADAGYFISEVWTCNASREEAEKNGVVPPSELPERREALLLIYEYKNEEKVEGGTLIAYFHKEGGKVVLGEEKEMEDIGVGRFTFFSRKKPFTLKMKRSMPEPNPN